ncbi:MAG: Eco57I restriction-modification methylase domain-containing protein [Candidatus Binatia bacterium]
MQTSLNLPVRMPKEAYAYGTRTSGGAHGVVLTKPHVVELILDLAGYTSDRDLADQALLEPSCGHGAFLVAAVARLLESARRSGRGPSTLADAVLAFDIEAAHVTRTRQALLGLLRDQHVRQRDALRLVESWVREDDFLLTPIDRTFAFVIGNPPYIRIEQLAEALQSEYRARYRSLYDRADLYVAFIERGLSVLSAHGGLSFICADRWVSNKYGAPLREIVSARHRVRYYVDLHTASPFESDVVAYPSIFVLGRGKSAHVPVVTLQTASVQECQAVTAALAGAATEPHPGVSVDTYTSWFEGGEPWVLSSPLHLETLRALEARLAPIEATARVGIGVATGNDKLYIVGRDADIEPDRLVPLVMRDDIEKGTIRDGGHFVINTFDDTRGVIDLDRYPRLRSYLMALASDIKQRHVAKKNPNSWFRTIDRVYPNLVTQPKLLIPDIAGSNQVAFDVGRFHPHHNLYFITSDHWDLEVLGALLSSKVALFFVWSYAVKMRGGYLRFQAQYLRRIRLPDPDTFPATLAAKLKAAFRERQFAHMDQLALQAYGLSRLPAFTFVDTRR